MPIKIMYDGEQIAGKKLSKRPSRRPAKWKIKEQQPFSKKQIDPKDLPKRPKKSGITYPRKPRKKYNIGGRANLLEEVGRLDAEKMNPNRRAEKKRVIRELNKGYKGGGMAQRGLGRAFMKGGKA